MAEALVRTSTGPAAESACRKRKGTARAAIGVFMIVFRYSSSCGRRGNARVQFGSLRQPRCGMLLNSSTGHAVWRGSMSFRAQLHAYIAQLERRLRWSALLRGLAILTVSALVATLVLVTIANALAFSQGSVTAARFRLR